MDGMVKPASRSRQAEADRRRNLLEAAERVFLRKGYAAATMDDVARAAGMSKRTLYQRFESKTALFEAMIAASLAPLRIDAGLVEHEPDIARALGGMLLTCARHFLAAQQCELFRVIIAEVRRSPELADAFHRAGPGSGASSLEMRIEAEMRRGRLRPADPRKTADMLYGMAMGAAHMKVLLGLADPPDETEIAERVDQAVAVFLRGALVAESHSAAA